MMLEDAERDPYTEAAGRITNKEHPWEEATTEEITDLMKERTEIALLMEAAPTTTGTTEIIVVSNESETKGDIKIGTPNETGMAAESTTNKVIDSQPGKEANETE